MVCRSAQPHDLQTVHAGKLLEHLDPTGKTESMEVPLIAHFESARESKISSTRRLLDLIHFLVNFGRVLITVVEICQSSSSLIDTTGRNKPSRRLWRDKHARYDKQREENWQRKWESPAD